MGVDVGLFERHLIGIGIVVHRVERTHRHSATLSIIAMEQWLRPPSTRPLVAPSAFESRRAVVHVVLP